MRKFAFAAALVILTGSAVNAQTKSTPQAVAPAMVAPAPQAAALVAPAPQAAANVVPAAQAHANVAAAAKAAAPSKVAPAAQGYAAAHSKYAPAAHAAAAPLSAQDGDFSILASIRPDGIPPATGSGVQR